MPASGRVRGLGVFGALVTIAVAGCASDDGPVPSIAERGTPPDALARCQAGPAVEAQASLEVEALAEGLETPWALAGLPDGRILVTERPGRVRVLTDQGLDPEPWLDLRDTLEGGGGEGGLMGIVAAPELGGPAVYLMRSLDRREREPRWRSIGRSLLLRAGFDLVPHRVSEVLLVREVEGHARVVGSVIEKIPSGLLHAGGALALVPGPELLVSIGDGALPATAQDPRDARGSIVRVVLDGASGLPPGGALDGSGVLPLLASGVRNSQGIAPLPDGGGVLFIDHGPSGLEVEGGRRAKDELNRVALDASDPVNFGWPIEAGIHEEPRFTPPLVEWPPSPEGFALAPAGLALVEAPGYPELLLAAVSGLRGRTLRLVELDRAGTPRCEVELLDATWGRLRAVAPHPGGGLLVGTSNRDGRGAPREGDDRILHLRWYDS